MTSFWRMEGSAAGEVSDLRSGVAGGRIRTVSKGRVAVLHDRGWIRQAGRGLPFCTRLQHVMK